MGPPLPNNKTVLDMVLEQITHVRDGQDDLREDFNDHRVVIEGRLTAIETRSKQAARGQASWVSLVVSVIVTAIAALFGIPRAS